MRRREFIALLGGAATAWAVAARAQQPVQPVVTLINARRANAGAPLAAEFRKGLSQTGFVEGRDVAVEYHWLGGQCEAAAAIIDDAVKRNVAVIATPGQQSRLGHRQSRRHDNSDRVWRRRGSGDARPRREPGGNATGINFFASEIDAKRLGPMHELLPKARRFAVLVNPANPVTTEATSKALKEAAPGLGIELVLTPARRRDRCGFHRDPCRTPTPSTSRPTRSPPPGARNS